MSEKLISLMIDENVYDTLKDYCYKENLKVKHFIREAVISALFSRGVKNGKKSVKR